MEKIMKYVVDMNELYNVYEDTDNAMVLSVFLIYKESAFDTFNISIQDVFNLLQTNIVSVIIVCQIGGIGCCDNILAILEFFLKIYKFFKNFIIAMIFPYKILEESVHYDKNFINDVIYKSKCWPIGFISSNNFRFKKIVEKSIMKKLGYKVKNKKWVYDGDIYRFPNELI